MSGTISVVIPAYNRPDTLRIALQSVAAQTRLPNEIMVVDDGASQAVRGVAREFGAKYILADKRGGVARARNCGIAESSGELIALLDDDDAWPLDKLAGQEAVLRAHPDAALAVGGVETVGARYGFPDGGVETLPQNLDIPGSGISLYAFLLRSNPILSPGQILIRRAALSSLPGPPFDDAIWGSDDWDLWLRLAQNSLFAWDERPALLYRVHETNASRDLVKMYRGAFAMYEKHSQRQESDAERAAVRAARNAFFRRAADCCFATAHAQTNRTRAVWEMARMVWAFPDMMAYKAGRRFARKEAV